MKTKEDYQSTEKPWYRKIRRLAVLHLLPEYTTDVYSLLAFLYHNFSVVEYSSCVSSLLFLYFYRPIPTCIKLLHKLFNPKLCSFFAAWQQTRKKVLQYMYLYYCVMNGRFASNTFALILSACMFPHSLPHLPQDHQYQYTKCSTISLVVSQ